MSSSGQRLDEGGAGSAREGNELRTQKSVRKSKELRREKE